MSTSLHDNLGPKWLGTDHEPGPARRDGHRGPAGRRRRSDPPGDRGAGLAPGELAGHGAGWQAHVEDLAAQITGSAHAAFRVSLENHLHHQFAGRRVNLINQRREFFRARPAEVRDILTRLEASIVRWVDEPEALEWRQSETTRRQQNPATMP